MSRQAGGAHTRTDGEPLEFVKKTEVTGEINEECQVVFEELKLRRKHRYIIFKIGETEIEIEKVGGRTESYDDFKSNLPFSDSRYGIFDQEYKTHDGRPASKV